MHVRLRTWDIPTHLLSMVSEHLKLGYSIWSSFFWRRGRSSMRIFCRQTRMSAKYSWASRRMKCMCSACAHPGGAEPQKAGTSLEVAAEERTRSEESPWRSPPTEGGLTRSSRQRHSGRGWTKSLQSEGHFPGIFKIYTENSPESQLKTRESHIWRLLKVNTKISFEDR